MSDEAVGWAYDLAEMAAGAPGTDTVDGLLGEDLPAGALDVLAAQARLAALLAGSVARRHPGVSALDVLRSLRVESAVVSARGELDGLDDGLPFDG